MAAQGEHSFGVEIGDLQKIQKRINKDHQLALELYTPDLQTPCIWPA